MGGSGYMLQQKCEMVLMISNIKCHVIQSISAYSEVKATSVG